jgi:hypothetical protein
MANYMLIKNQMLYGLPIHKKRTKGKPFVAFCVLIAKSLTTKNIK